MSKTPNQELEAEIERLNNQINLMSQESLLMKVGISDTLSHSLEITDQNKKLQSKIDTANKELDIYSKIIGLCDVGVTLIESLKDILGDKK